MTTISRTKAGLYRTRRPVTDQELIGFAQGLIAEQFTRQGSLNDVADAQAFLIAQLAPENREVFAVVFLDRQHRIISFERLFYGTIDRSMVYPREILKRCLTLNAAAVILAHNHPSGCPEPSAADKDITRQIITALFLIDVAVLDHFVIGGTKAISFSRLGLLAKE